jgi:tetratricopeptide (TPR) repeat protein
LQARVYHYDHTPARHLVARNCLEETVESSPAYVEAVAELAYIYLEEYRHDYNPRPDSVARGIAMARRAVALDTRNATAHWTLALGHFSSGNLDAFYAEADRALELNPNDATMLQFIAHFIAPTGQWEKGLALMSKSQKLNPGAPNWSHVVFALDHYRKGEYEMALARFNQVDTGISTSIKSQQLAILGQLDRRDESDALLTNLQDTVPGYSIETARQELVVKRHFDSDFAAKIFEGLRKAGVPETLPTK